MAEIEAAQPGPQPALVLRAPGPRLGQGHQQDGAERLAQRVSEALARQVRPRRGADHLPQPVAHGLVRQRDLLGGEDLDQGLGGSRPGKGAEEGAAGQQVADRLDGLGDEAGAPTLDGGADGGRVHAPTRAKRSAPKSSRSA